MQKLKFLTATVFSTLFSTGAFAHGQNIGACDPAQARFGGNGGNPFIAVAPGAVQMRTGAFVDAVILNGRQYGQNGGNAGQVLNLRDEEYINRIVVRHGQLVDRLELYTNFGRSVTGGGNGGNVSQLNNIRVLTIGGRSGQYLDQIEVTYCMNYR